MKPWLAVGLSFLVALALHAIVLFAVRVAGQGDPEAPVVEVALEGAWPTGAGSTVSATPLTRAVNASGPAKTRVPVSTQNGPLNESGNANNPRGAPSGEGETASTAGAESSSGGIGAIGATGNGSASGIAEDLPGGGGGELAAATPARPTTEIQPIYPRSARKAGQVGTVRIATSIDETGGVISAEVLSSSGYEALDRAALQAVQRARFEPALKAGKPISWRLTIPIRFHLN